MARLGAALVARGHNVFVLDAPKVVQDMQDEFDAPATLLQSLPSWLGRFRTKKTLALAHSHHIDIVHILTVGPRQAVWTEPGAPPFVITVAAADLTSGNSERSAAQDSTVDTLMSMAGAVTADSQPVLRRAINRMAANPAPRAQVLWGSDLSTFDRDLQREQTARFREQLQIDPDVPVLMSPRPPLTPYHVDRIIAAFHVSDWCKRGVLVIKRQGKRGEGNYVNFMLSLARQRRIDDRVRIAPRATEDELPSLLALADAAVSLPVTDGVPRTFLELMALQVPILGWNLPAYEGIVVSGERGGILAGLGDQGGIIDGINLCLHDVEKRRALGAAGRTWVLEHGDWGKSVQRWIGMYRGAMAQRGAG